MSKPPPARATQVRVKLSTKEKSILLKKAKRSGLDMSEFIRTLIFKSK